MMAPALPLVAPKAAAALSVAVPTTGDIPDLIALVNLLATEPNFLFIMPIDPKTGIAVVSAHLASIAATKNECVFVARYGRELIGVVTGIRGTHPARRGAIDIGIGVRPDFRGRGIGFSLMEALERWARSVGCHRLQLRVVSTNQPAVALYRKLGYEVEGMLRAGAIVQGARYDDLQMAKILN